MRSTDTRPTGMARVAGPPWLNRIDWLLLFLVLAVAIFFRLWQQGQVPPGMNFDEAFESLEARRLLAEPGYRPVYFTGNWGIPSLEIYLTALAFLIADRPRPMAASSGPNTMARRWATPIPRRAGIGVRSSWIVTPSSCRLTHRAVRFRSKQGSIRQSVGAFASVQLMLPDNQRATA